MAVFNRLLLSQIKVIALVWTVVTVFMLGARWFAESHVLFGVFCIIFIMLGSYSGILLPKAYFVHGRYLSVLKLSAKNLKSFWFLLVLQNVIIIILNASVAVMCVYSVAGHIKVNTIYDIPSLFTTSGYMCLFIILLLLMIKLDCYQPFDKIGNSVIDKKNKLREIFSLLCLIVFFFAVGILYDKVSPLFAMAFGTVLVFVIMMFTNTQIIKSLHRGLQKKYAAVGAGSLFVVFSLIAVFEMQTVPESEFLWVRENKWAFSDIEKVTSVEEWMMWQNKLRGPDVLTVDQMVEIYDKVNQYCPPKPRDNPLFIECEGSGVYRDYQYTSTSPRSEEDVLKLMSSSNEYAQIMGLMYARKLQKPLSKDIIIAIEVIAEKESTIQGLARNTLSNSFPENYRDGIIFVTKKITDIQKN